MICITVRKTPLYTYLPIIISRNTLKYSIRENWPRPGIDHVCLAKQYLVIY